jgi:hypothetical protein
MVEVFNLEFLSSSLNPFIIFFSHNVLFNIVEKTKQTYVLPFFEECYSNMTTSFDP